MTENERIKILRKYLKFSQSKMAEVLGIKQSAYSAIENGFYNTTSKQIKILINNFNVNSNWLLNGEGEMLKTGAPEEEAKASSEILYEKVMALKYFLIGRGFWDESTKTVVSDLFGAKFKVSKHA